MSLVGHNSMNLNVLRTLLARSRAFFDILTVGTAAAFPRVFLENYHRLSLFTVRESFRRLKN